MTEQFITYEEFESKSKDDQADILRQLIDSYGMKQIISGWKIPKDVYHNLVHELNIVVRRGRKRRIQNKDLSKANKGESKAKPNRKNTEQQLPTQLPAPQLAFSLEGKYKGKELSSVLTGLSRMVEDEGWFFKVVVKIERE